MYVLKRQFYALSGTCNLVLTKGISRSRYDLHFYRRQGWCTKRSRKSSNSTQLIHGRAWIRTQALRLGRPRHLLNTKLYQRTINTKSKTLICYLPSKKRDWFKCILAYVAHAPKRMNGCMGRWMSGWMMDGWPDGWVAGITRHPFGNLPSFLFPLPCTEHSLHSRQTSRYHFSPRQERHGTIQEQVKASAPKSKWWTKILWGSPHTRSCSLPKVIKFLFAS